MAAAWICWISSGGTLLVRSTSSSCGFSSCSTKARMLSISICCSEVRPKSMAVSLFLLRQSDGAPRKLGQGQGAVRLHDLRQLGGDLGAKRRGLRLADGIDVHQHELRGRGDFVAEALGVH